MSELYSLDSIFGHIEMKSEFIHTGPLEYDGYFLNTVTVYGYRGRIIRHSVERGIQTEGARGKV